jgi:hypothetical protein
MNSFGKRNFMQPTGRPKHALKVPCFFFHFKFGWGKEREKGFFFIFPWLPMCAHYGFTSSSQYVSPKFPICSP